MTRRPRNPLSGGLIEVAGHLADVRGRPIVVQAALRRALSTAYYAVFHALAQVCCDGLGLRSAAADEVEMVYRNLDHGRARDVLASPRARALHENVTDIASAFVELRRMREDADYSQPGRLGADQRPPTRSETVALIALAEETVRLLDGLPPDVRRRLAILLTVRGNRR